MTEPEPIGSLLDSLGVKHSPEDGELVSSAIVLLKVIDAEGDVSLRMVHSDGLDWIDRLGMCQAAQTIESGGLQRSEDD